MIQESPRRERGPAWLAAIISLMLLASPPARAGPSADTAAADLHALVADYEAFSREEDPIRAGARGETAALRLWPDDSSTAVAARKARLAAFQTRLNALAAASLSEGDALNRDILKQRVDMALEGEAFDMERLPFVSGEGFFTLPDDTAQATVIHNEADAEAWLARLDAIPAFYATETVNMRRGLATGFTQPRIIVEKAILAVRTSVDQPPGDSDLLTPFAVLPAQIPAEAQRRLRAKALEIVATRVKPAQRDLLTFFQEDYLPKARAAVGASTLPEGAAWYRYLVRFHTTTEMTPDEVHQLGLKRVAEIHAQMEQAMARTGFKGSLPEFLAYLRADPRFYAPSGAAYLERARSIAKRIDFLLPQWFGKLPRLTYGVEPVPAALDFSSGGYRPGSPEMGVAGSVMLRPGHYKSDPLYSLPAWLLHEGVPGHHIQIALAQENLAVPEYRRNDDVTAFVEGWALYAEGLGEEMGVYQDDYERFGRLSYAMWRACRLVVDTGLHQDGWSRDQAIAYLRANTALTEAAMAGEVDRYIAWPGQADAYMVGELRIEAMRRRAEARLGGRFNIRRFHDFILDDGPMPLDLLDARLDAWIKRQGG
jgi:uncharacterized protein (DUF885 family)